MPECPQCNESDDVTTNKLFSVNNPNRWYCEDCGVFFDN